MQIIPGRQETLRRLYFSQIIREGILQASIAADGYGIAAGSRESAAVIAKLAIGEAEPDDVLLRYAQALVAFEAFVAPDLSDTVFLVKAAIAHAAVGNDEDMDGHFFPFGELDEKTRPENGVVVVRAYHKEALFFALPVSRNIGKFRAYPSLVSDQAYKFEIFLHLSELTVKVESQPYKRG